MTSFKAVPTGLAQTVSLSADDHRLRCLVRVVCVYWTLGRNNSPDKNCPSCRRRYKYVKCGGRLKVQLRADDPRVVVLTLSWSQTKQTANCLLLTLSVLYLSWLHLTWSMFILSTLLLSCLVREANFGGVASWGTRILSWRGSTHPSLMTRGCGMLTYEAARLT